MEANAKSPWKFKNQCVCEAAAVMELTELGVQICQAETLPTFCISLTNVTTVNTEELRGLVELRHMFIKQFMSRNSHCSSSECFSCVWMSLSQSVTWCCSGTTVKNLIGFGRWDPQKTESSQFFMW